MEPTRHSVRPAVLLSMVGLLVIVLRVQVSWLETTQSHVESGPKNVAQEYLLVGTFASAAILSLVATLALKRRVNSLLAVLVASAVGGLITARYDAMRGFALGTAIGSLVAWAPLIGRAVRGTFLTVIPPVSAGIIGGATILAVTGNPGDGWHGPFVWSMSALTCGAGSLLAWHAWRRRTQDRKPRLVARTMFFLAIAFGQWLSLSVDTLRRVRWLGTEYKTCEIPFEQWLYRGVVGVLEFNGGRRVDDSQLATIGGWKELWSLRLNGAAVTDAGLVHIARLTQLRNLEMVDSAITGSGLANLAKLTCLDRLDLSGTQVTDRSLLQLPTFPSLRFLYVNGTHVTDDALLRLQRFPALMELGLAGTDVRGEGLWRLNSLPSLQHLNLADTAVTDDVLDYLMPPFGVPQPIQILDLSGTRITDQGLNDVRWVWWLKLARTRITDEGLKQLARVTTTRLGRLDLSSTRVTDQGLRQLAHFPGLTMLDLTDTDVTDAGLEYLKTTISFPDQLRLGRVASEIDLMTTLSFLDQLRLARTRVTDEGMKQLAGALRLSELDLSDTRVTDVGLAPLSSLPRLRQLQLAGTSVTAEGLVQLQRLPKLSDVDVRRTAITVVDLPLLRKKFPNATIVIDGRRE